MYYKIYLSLTPIIIRIQIAFSYTPAGNCSMELGKLALLCFPCKWRRTKEISHAKLPSNVFCTHPKFLGIYTTNQMYQNVVRFLKKIGKFCGSEFCVHCSTNPPKSYGFATKPTSNTYELPNIMTI